MKNKKITIISIFSKKRSVCLYYMLLKKRFDIGTVIYPWAVVLALSRRLKIKESTGINPLELVDLRESI